MSRRNHVSTLALATAVLAFPAWSRAGVVYVNATPPVGSDNSGSSWNNANPDLQNAITNAQFDDLIWVAAGTYNPSERTDSEDSRSATFILHTNTKLYGGFDGTESSFAERAGFFDQTSREGCAHHLAAVIRLPLDAGGPGPPYSLTHTPNWCCLSTC